MNDTDQSLPGASTPSTDRSKPRSHRWRRIALAAAAAFLVLAVAIGLWIRLQLVGSLAQLDGEATVSTLEHTVSVERDALGVPTVSGQSRADVARALGFIHAQERFFQMDLLRRQAAGELSELFGSAALRWDRFIRIHQLRATARATYADLEAQGSTILAAYCEGVNEGLTSLDVVPFEYLVLRNRPREWKPEDSLLVVLAMFIELHDEDGSRESAIGLVHDLMPPAMAEVLTAPGTPWDAPITGPAFDTPPLPEADVFSLRTTTISGEEHGTQEEDSRQVVGSNNWAVSGALTTHGGAIIANDMHLGISVPNTWFRASLSWPDSDLDTGRRRITGVSLPGVPGIIAGTNEHIAWGFTNSYGDWVDLVVLDADPNDPDTYLTPEGPRTIEKLQETILVHGAEAEILEIEKTIWGPVIDRDHQGRRRALRWTALVPGGLDLGLGRLELTTTLEEALDVASTSGMPPQNLVIADRRGRIAWTIIGRIPNRFGFDGRVPTSWSDGSRGWDGWIDPERHPRIVSPPGERLWTANARVVDGKMLATIGDGGYAFGARAHQIRQNLMDRDSFSERDMLAIQLDHRALFLERWRDLLLDVLDEDAVAANPRRAELRRLVQDWDARAGVDSVGFRMVRAYRSFLSEQMLESLTTSLREADEDFGPGELGQTEGLIWQLVKQQPLHLLDPKFESWSDQLISGVDATIEYFTENGARLEDQSWGRRNTARIQHPLSQAIPMLGRWLDMPAEPLPGDSNMPRAQGPSFGASQRSAVSPGREEQGFFHMPCGQSGHPLSPFYRAGHDAWAKGEPSPFLPGETVYTLTLTPEG